MHALRDCFIASSVLLLLATSNVVAQGSESATNTNSSVDAKEASDTTVTEKAGTPTAEPPKQNEPQKKFEPSEEVSEDLSIPFPVDI